MPGDAAALPHARPNLPDPAQPAAPLPADLAATTVMPAVTVHAGEEPAAPAPTPASPAQATMVLPTVGGAEAAPEAGAEAQAAPQPQTITLPPIGNATEPTVVDITPGAAQAGGATGLSPANAGPAPKGKKSKKTKKAKAQHKHRGLRALGITLASVAGALVVAYVGFAVFFIWHFGFNTTINNAACAFKTPAQVQQLIRAQVANYQLAIEARGGTAVVISGSSVNLKYTPDNQVEQLLQSQNPWLWPVRLFTRMAPSTTLGSVTYDASSLQSKVAALAIMQSANQTAPVDASLVFDSSTSKYVVQPEQLGTTLDAAATQAAVSQAFSNTTPTLDLSAAGCYVAPKVYSDDAQLNATLAQWNQYVPFSITYTFGDTSEVLDGNTTMGWLTTASDGSQQISDDAIKSWLKDFASRHDTVGAERTFTSMDGSQATVSGGTYGWQIDQSKEFDAIKSDIANHTGETRDPYYSSTAASNDPNDEWGDTYVEVSIKDQHMWYVKDGQVALESDVVTGLPTAKRATPTGVYSILEKLHPTVLKGDRQPDGTWGYQTPVTYWMRVTWTGIGLHDATWQPYFGGSRYKSGGSHGCINMPYAKAQELYGMLEVGTPVIIHN
jgi:lipoprotein-anchoring transpeptidase ErfK/SrfK